MIKDIFDTLVTLMEFVKGKHEGNIELRKEYFKNYIDESFKRMESIHTDYMTNLNMLIKIEQKKEKTTEQIIEWLKEKKISFQTSRDRVKQLEDEVFNNQYFSKTFKKNTEISKYSIQYLNDIVTYFFRGPLYLPGMSWYTYMIQAFEFSFALQQKSSKNEPTGVSTNATTADIPNEIKNTIGFIESQFNFISDSYSTLKKLCLK